MAKFIERFRLALTLNRDFYGEVISDPGTQGHSLWVVAVYAMAAAFGTFGRAGGTTVNIALMTTLVTWYLWAFTTYYVGTHLFAQPDTPRDRKTVMRVMGFASAPGALRIFGIIPNLSGFLIVATSIWMLYAAATSLQRALKYDSLARALGVTVACFVLSMFVQAVLMVMLVQLFAVYTSR